MLCFPAYDFGCLDISDIENGNTTILELNSQHELHFTCFPGYKLVGKSKIICYNGQWENEPKPQCVRGRSIFVILYDRI